MQILPSIICGNVLNFAHTIKTFDPICNGYHIDVMDDHFVPNMTIGPSIVNAISNATSLPCHIHLMVDKPQTWPNRLKIKKNDILIFHLETVFNKNELLMLIKNIKNNGWLVGIAINPSTGINDLYMEIMPYLDNTLVMAVIPGFSGQKFIPEVMEKVKNLVSIKKHYNARFEIAIDGGVDKFNIATLKNLGVNIFCVGSAIFLAQDQCGALQELYSLLV